MRTGDAALDELGAELLARGAELLDPSGDLGDRRVATVNPEYSGRHLWVWKSRDGERYLCRHWQVAGSLSAPAAAADTIIAMLAATDAGRW